MHPDKLNVCVIGLGYIGLPTATLLASHNINVIGVDVNPSVVSTVNASGVHIVEPDLDEKVRSAVQSGRLRASPSPSTADVYLIAVPTPLDDEKNPVVDHVIEAARTIAPHLRTGNLVILESTSPVGTTERLCTLFAKLRPDMRFPLQSDDTDADIAVAYCPERVLPGRIMHELIENDRCIGGVSKKCATKARQFYEIFVRGACVETSARTAEMVKLTENAFRDLNIAFANELSMICDQLDINVWELIQLANRHPRVDILKPGPGVGGHCIAVDPWFIVNAAPDCAKLIRTARDVNDSKQHYVLDQIRTLAEAHADRQITCLGLSFKANVDDLRESPALEIVEALASTYGERVKIVEPFIDQLPEQIERFGAQLVALEAALRPKSLLILLVDHDLFRDLGTTCPEGAIIYDTRGVLAPSVMVAEERSRLRFVA